MKRTALSLLLSCVAVSAFAAEGSFDVAIADRDSYRQKKNMVMPPSVTENREYYEVTGCAEKELRDKMTQNAGVWHDGKKYDSVTTWHVKWEYDHDQAPRSCAAESFHATVDVTIRYPKWVRTDDVPQTLVDKWDGYIKSLVTHETGHRDMAVEAAADLSRAVADLPPAPTCTELDRNVQALCHKRMKKLEEDSRTYDASTLHGIAQGAVFP